MKAFFKIGIFITVFTVVFYFLRADSGFVFNNLGILVADLGGLTYLYSMVGIIFAIFAAFVILSEVERWNNLVDAVNGEVVELNELWLWSHYLPKPLQSRFKENIQIYLEKIIQDEWHTGIHGKKHESIESVLSTLHGNISDILKEAPQLMPEIFSTFTDLIKYREKRIHYTSFRLPPILKRTLFFSDVLLVILSFLIGVRNNWLDYIFVLSIAMLGYIIHLLINDMDNPTKQGGWHITTNNYRDLLQKIKTS